MKVRSLPFYVRKMAQYLPKASGATLNTPEAVAAPFPMPAPLPITSPLPLGGLPLPLEALASSLTRSCATPANRACSFCANSCNSPASRRTFFGLNLLSAAFFPRPRAPPLLPLVAGGTDPLPVDSVLCTGARTGVGAGVSVGTVAGEELGEGAKSSSRIFCGVVILGAGGSAADGGEASRVDWLAGPSSVSVIGTSAAGSAAAEAVAFPRPRPRPLAPPREPLGGIVMKEELIDNSQLCHRIRRIVL
jgi:hypothetical protein